MEETDKKEMKNELLESKGADLNTIQSIASQPVCSMDKINSDPVIISTLKRSVSEDGTEKDATVRSYGKFHTTIKRKLRNQ